MLAEVVVPLLSMSNSVLLCISTLLESGNHYSKMFDLTDSIGRKLFESISITLYARSPTALCRTRAHSSRVCFAGSATTASKLNTPKSVHISLLKCQDGFPRTRWRR